MYGGPKPCRFGLNCRNLAQGNCKFDHSKDNVQGNTGGQNPKGPRGPNQSHGGGGNYNPNNNNPNYGYHSNNGPNGPNGPQNYPSNNNSNFNGPNGPNKHNRNQHNNNGPNSNPNNYQNQNQPNQFKGDEFSQKFCRNAHLGFCKYEGKCNRIHDFDVDKPPKMRRVNFIRDVPTHDQSKLGKFVNQGKTYLVMRNGNAVNIFTFDYNTENFQEIGKWDFPNPEIKYVYYAQRENYIYLAAENKTLLFDVAIYDMLSQNLVAIPGAHEMAVTGALHVTPNIVLTSSKDGTIKVWKVEGQTASLDKEISDKLTKSFNPDPTVKAEVLFLEYQNIKGMNIIAGGTNDGRVLFFIGDGMEFKQLVLGQKHGKVYMIKYYTSGNNAVAFVVTWAANDALSHVVAVDLNQFQTNEVVVADAKEGPRNNIYLIETFGERLFVSYLNGNVTFYDLPQFERKGLALHGNFVNSLVMDEHLTNTNITLHYLYLLEGRYKGKEGSLGIYILKN